MDGTLTGELFIGCGPDNVVYRIGDMNDSEEQRIAVWKELCTAFTSENSVFVFHMKNHYAPVFALREWKSSNDQIHRELLSARRGQRPSSWITWREAYNTMTTWHGYKILRFTSIVDT